MPTSPHPWDRTRYRSLELPSSVLTAPEAAGHLADAALYITKLPKAEHDAKEWQAAMEALLLVAEHDGPTMFSRIGVMRALNRGHVREFDTSRKDTHWGKRKLKRDE